MDRLLLDWLTETPGGPVNVTVTARNVNAASRLVLVVPPPVDPDD